MNKKIYEVADQLIAKGGHFAELVARQRLDTEGESGT